MNTLSVKASLEHLSELIEHVSKLSHEHIASAEQRMSIEIAVEEAVVNVIHYAYPEGVQGDIKLSCHVENHQLIITISDQGVPYNPLLREEPELSEDIDDRPIGGLGIFFINQIMDDVRYKFADGYNILTLIKNFDTLDE